MAKDPTKRGKTVHEKEKDNTKFNNNNNNNKQTNNNNTKQNRA